MESIKKFRDWIRTNGDMSEDGKSITYDCKLLEKAIEETLIKLPCIHPKDACRDIGGNKYICTLCGIKGNLTLNK